MSAEYPRTPLVEAKSIYQRYDDIEVLHGIDLAVYPHELTVVTGESGSGKSTLLNVLAGLKAPAEGEVVYHGNGEPIDVAELKGDKLGEFRASQTALVTQQANLLGDLSVERNIVVPARLAGVKVGREWFEEISDALGIRGLLARKAMTLSGGQQQRVSLARALVRRPVAVMADEPTAALDVENKHQLYELLRDKVVRKLGGTVVVVAHDEVFPDYADRVITLRDGRIIDDARPDKPKADEIIA